MPTLLQNIKKMLTVLFILLLSFFMICFINIQAVLAADPTETSTSTFTNTPAPCIMKVKG
ncbi:MAG: hypothetical protein FP831_18760 [Anaerolineae bacterium]|nr:hypothetical protein [Anaerolineae bacterium]